MTKPVRPLVVRTMHEEATDIDIIEHMADANRSPRSRLERFAQNFRNMGVVTDVMAKRARVVPAAGVAEVRGDTLLVTTTTDGMNVTNVREKGWDFHIESTWCDTAAGREPGIVHALRLVETDDE